MIKVDGLSHVGIVVPDLDVASTLFAQRFGCAVGDPIDVPEQKLRIAYVDLGPVKMELLTPTDATSPIAKFLDRHPKGGLHHVALYVPDAATAAEDGAQAGFQVLGDGPQAGHHGRPLFFLHPKDTLGALLEIEEREPPAPSNGTHATPKHRSR